MRPLKLHKKEVRLTKYILAPHSGLSADFRRLNNFGDFHQCRVCQPLFCAHNAVSELKIPTDKMLEAHKSDAMFYSIGWHYNWFDIAAALQANPNVTFGSTQGVGFSAIVAWQDASPFLYRETINGKSHGASRFGTLAYTLWH